MNWSDIKQSFDMQLEKHGGDAFDVEFANVSGRDPNTDLLVSLNMSYRNPYRPHCADCDAE